MTETKQPLATETTEPLATGTKQPLATETTEPLATGTKQPLATGTKQPLATGTKQPLATGIKQRMPAAERRELVLEAAVAEFAAHGLAGTSTEDVARRAGISQPYLFRLFPTKKALFITLVERCFQRVRDTFTAAAADLTGDEALMAMADAYERLLEDRTLLLLQMQAYAACDDPDVRVATRTGYRQLWELSERLTGLPFQTIVDFFAVGMLMNVAAAMDLPSVDERWTSWCPKK